MRRLGQVSGRHYVDWHSFLCLRVVVHAVPCALNPCALLPSGIFAGLVAVSVRIEQPVVVLLSVSLPALGSGCAARG